PEGVVVVAADAVVAAREEANGRRQLREVAVVHRAELAPKQDSGLIRWRPDPLTVQDYLHEARVREDRIGRTARLELELRTAIRADGVVGVQARPVDAGHQQLRGPVFGAEGEVLDEKSEYRRPKPVVPPTCQAPHADLQAVAVRGFRVLGLYARVEREPVGPRVVDRHAVVRR